MIIAAALKIRQNNKEYIIVGKKPDAWFKIIYESEEKQNNENIQQGFLTDDFNFLTPKEARQYAIDYYQVEEKDLKFNELRNEDLWKE